LFAEKSWTLLAFLFGYGFALLMDNLSQKGINKNLFFIKRMFWLAIIALISSSLFFGNILISYPLMGLTLLLFRPLSTKVVGYISIILALLIPAINAFILSNQTLGMAGIKEYLPLLESHNLLDVLRFGLMGSYHHGIAIGNLVTGNIVMLTCFLLACGHNECNFLMM